MKKLLYTCVMLLMITVLWFLCGDIKNLLSQETFYDLTNQNPAVTSYAGIDAVLQDLPSLQFHELDENWRCETKLDHKKYTYMLQDQVFYVVRKEDLNKKIVGRHRIKEFVSQDKHFRMLRKKKIDRIYCILNKDVLYKFLELKRELSAEGYNPSAMKVISGYRTPKKNESLSGAGSLSRHMHGDAVDLEIYDINRDGRYTRMDKQIVLDLLETNVIGDRGGIGKYAWSNSIHFDVRGTRARW